MAHKPPDNTRGRDTPEWKKFFELERARRPNDPEWWTAYGADAAYARYRTFVFFQQDTIRKTLEMQRDPAPPASPAKPVSWQQEALAELERLAEAGALVRGVGKQAENVHYRLTLRNIKVPSVDQVERAISKRFFALGGQRAPTRSKPD